MEILAKTGSEITFKGGRALWIRGISGKPRFSGAEGLLSGTPLQVIAVLFRSDSLKSTESPC